jgi:hypothetical protein
MNLKTDEEINERMQKKVKEGTKDEEIGSTMIKVKN